MQLKYQESSLASTPSVCNKTKQLIGATSQCEVTARTQCQWCRWNLTIQEKLGNKSTFKKNTSSFRHKLAEVKVNSHSPHWTPLGVFKSHLANEKGKKSDGLSKGSKSASRSVSNSSGSKDLKLQKKEENENLSFGKQFKNLLVFMTFLKVDKAH